MKVMMIHDDEHVEGNGVGDRACDIRNGFL